MIATANGFLYNKETKEIIAEIYEGDEIFTSQGIFYGTKEQAIKFRLIFKEE